MSADNWTTCPRCADKGPGAKEKALKNAKSQYGKISADDYVRLVNEANAMAEETPEETLREDYSIGVYEGVFAINYHCECTHCDFEFRHTFKKQL